MRNTGNISNGLLFALSRFAPRITKVNVYIADHNGPNGGIDESCQIIVQMPGFTNLVAKTVDSDWIACIDRGTTRIGQRCSSSSRKQVSLPGA